jgi:dCMP deaminase
MANLMAYLPVLNWQYLEWIDRHINSDVFIIPQSIAESLVPRLARNVGAVPAYDVAEMVKAVSYRKYVHVLHESEMSDLAVKSWLMPDEDVCHAFAEKYLLPSGCQVEFESIWARWDMSAVLAKQPIEADVEVTSRLIDWKRMQIACALKKKSPDWWRQIGVAAFRGDELLACAYNTHMPNEYVTVTMGDPALNRDAGTGEFDVTAALHGEEGLVCQCAKRGISLEGASLYSTTMPCPRCTRIIVAAGFSELFFEDGYSMLGAVETLRAHGVRIVKVKNPETA